MKTLKQIREENRKFIIMACNPGAKTYEEALEKELGFGCEIEYKNSTFLYFAKDRFRYDICSLEEDSFGPLCSRWHPSKTECRIIGKPLTLNRVLIALPVKDYEGFIIDNHGRLYDSYISTPYNGCKLTADGDYKFLWNYRKKTLEEQSEKTQRAVHKLNNK